MNNCFEENSLGLAPASNGPGLPRLVSALGAPLLQQGTVKTTYNINVPA